MALATRAGGTALSVCVKVGVTSDPRGDRFWFLVDHFVIFFCCHGQ